MFPEQITIHPITTLQGEINPPGDRSIAIRALLLSAISQQKVSLIHVPKIPAIRWLCEALSSLGVPIRKTGKSLEIEGIGLTGFKKVFSPLDMGDSATALRLLSGVLAGQNFETELTGYLSLQTRPQKRLIEPLSLMGANIRTLEGVKKLEALQSLSNEYRRLKDRIIRDDFYVPLHFYPRGSEGLKGISYKSSVASAQVKSAVLLASFYARGELTYREPYVSRNHMEQLLLDSGIKLTQRGSHLRLTCGQKLKMKERIAIPGDFSFAALYILAATLIPRSQIVIKGVGINRTRTGFLETLREMGASIEKMNERKMGREPVADLLISYRKLQGVKIPKERIPSMIDEIPLLTIAASQAASDTIIEGVNELKYKESDRQLGIIGLLQSFGGSAKIKNHTLYISGNKPLRGGSVSTFGDHRLGFAAIAAAVVSNRETLLRNTSSLKLSIETPDQLEPLLQ